MARGIRIIQAVTRSGKDVGASVLVEFGEESEAAAIGRFVQHYSTNEGRTIIGPVDVNDITDKCRAFFAAGHGDL